MQQKNTFKMLLSNTIHYVTDALGNQTSVILDYQEWEKINREVDVLKEKLAKFYSVDAILKKLERHQNTILTTDDVIRRAMISEANILNHEFSSVEDLERESEKW